MLKKIKEWFGIHTHDWDKWKVMEGMTNKSGDKIIFQSRVCKTCGLTQVKKTHI